MKSCVNLAGVIPCMKLIYMYRAYDNLVSLTPVLVFMCKTCMYAPHTFSNIVRGNLRKSFSTLIKVPK